MLVTELLKLDPSPEQAEMLKTTMRACNAATTYAANVAFEHRLADKIRLQGLVYAALREEFGLSAQMAIRAIAKACNAYKRDRTRRPKFRPLGAISYDRRILAWRGRDEVSILTLDGRQIIPVVYRGRWVQRLPERIRGQADLLHRDGNFYLVVVIEVPEPPAGPEPPEWIGVDLGLVNIATDSDGANHSDGGMRAKRRRDVALRARLQAKGTKSAKRLLKKRRRKEARYARDVNHCISKRIVGKAKDSGRGIKLEDLSGIRDRITVRKAQRADMHSWSFRQLRMFIDYKSKIAGVRLVLVDPRNTSRECPRCGYVDKANRPTRDKFMCLSCGLAGPADTIAAGNIARRAAIGQPHAA